MRIVVLKDRRRCGVGDCSPYIFVRNFCGICNAIRTLNIHLVAIVGVCLIVAMRYTSRRALDIATIVS